MNRTQFGVWFASGISGFVFVIGVVDMWITSGSLRFSCTNQPEFHDSGCGQLLDDLAATVHGLCVDAESTSRAHPLTTSYPQVVRKHTLNLRLRARYTQVIHSCVECCNSAIATEPRQGRRGTQMRATIGARIEGELP